MSKFLNNQISDFCGSLSVVNDQMNSGIKINNAYQYAWHFNVGPSKLFFYFFYLFSNTWAVKLILGSIVTVECVCGWRQVVRPPLAWCRMIRFWGWERPHTFRVLEWSMHTTHHPKHSRESSDVSEANCCLACTPVTTCKINVCVPHVLVCRRSAVKPHVCLVAG